MRFLAMLAGFAGAVLSAALFMCLLAVSTVIAVMPEFSEAARPTLAVTVPILAIIVANLSFSVFLPAIVLCELAAWRSWFVHALIGAGTALIVATRIAPPTVPEDGTDAGLLALAAAAGIVGGLAYWLIAGRDAGRWRDAFNAPKP